MTEPYDIETMRKVADTLLEHAHRDPDFRRELAEDPEKALAEAGLADALPDYVRAFKPLDGQCHCVDYTCVFTLCPETCLPGGTVDMTPLTVHGV